MMHSMAAMYAFLSSGEMSPLVSLVGVPSGQYGNGLPFAAHLEVFLGACLRLGELGIDVGPALVLEIQHCIARHEAGEQKPGDGKHPGECETCHGGCVGNDGLG